MLKRTRSVICLAIAASLAVPTPSMANALDLPDMGTVAGATLTIDQERQYGDAYMRIIRRSQPVIDDPVLNNYLSTLGHRLVANADDVKTNFRFFMIRDRNINAFAFFGGHVAIHSGLFLHAKDESELASVMAHEIAHVTQRHLARSMEEAARRSPASLAALAGGLLLALASPQAGLAVISAGTAGNMQAQINYTRSNEKEADRLGLNTLAKAGFDVQAMPRFFGRLSDQYRYATKPPPMLLTHPLPEDRITDSRIRAQSYPVQNVSESLDYHLARARVVARYSGAKAEDALDWMARQRKRTPEAMHPAADYGTALIKLDNRQFDEAQALLETLHQNDPNNLFYLDALSDLYLGMNSLKKAQTLLSQALTRSPENPVLVINHANVLLESGQFEQAISQLQRFTHAHPQDTNGWFLLAKANADLGKEAEELASRGEILALQANWDKAIHFYTQASQLAELGSLQQARYDARIDQLLVERERFLALQ
ncbi:M48 family metallopeptidase [Vibrio sp. SM6]|uniref:Putative beta-barrel assembly-enhancing protease n=1 Tax=Vibrio agarilyticus TaxID=2726741 RepID=A0A7X8YHB8_9VIBR|nr:M48 family metalloprotease [Vibrio agarilyticus]NLS13192.1 M48 family metallopeptidase [Vibrio agarilyticus]